MLLLGDKEGPDDGDQDYREDEEDDEEELGAREPVPKQQETKPQGRWAGTSTPALYCMLLLPGLHNSPDSFCLSA